MNNRRQKKRILLASALKPVDEPRMCERMGLSFVKHGFEVFITGFPTSAGKAIDGIEFLPHKKFKRISIRRIKVRFTILQKAFAAKPDLLIVTTHELIGIALLFKLFTGQKIVYDVQEDYWQNIMHTSIWPRFMRPLIAFPVRWKEWITSPFFSKFLLAEKCYGDDLRFARKRSVVVENKCKMPEQFQRKPSREIIRLIFTGTIAESTGIFEAINLAKKLYQAEPHIRLTIIGHCPQLKTLRMVDAEISGCSFIHLVGGRDFVAHEKIFESISSANFGVISYPLSPHTKNKIPSKLYEYLACQLPILLQENKLWEGLCSPSNAAITIDARQPDVDAILGAMRKSSFYSQTPKNANWQSEETALLGAIRSLV